MRLLLLFLSGCFSFQATHGPCKTSSECNAGFVCKDGRCEAGLDAAVSACGKTDDCQSGQVCVDSNCVTTGCDAQHLCKDACCNDGTCVLNDACPGGKNCSNGFCPGRCDSRGGGAGCHLGCCDIQSGDCQPGDSNEACGAANGPCGVCDNGTSCSDRTCACPACGAGQVCSGDGACANCADHPCGGNKPVCDGAATHSCQPCTSNAAVCGSEYCNEDGACGPPLSDSACARKDPSKPKLIGSGVCGCDASTACPNGLKCDTDTNSCFDDCLNDSVDHCRTGYCQENTCVPTKSTGSGCTASTQCSTGTCACTSDDCASGTRVCSVTCATCDYTTDGGATCAAHLQKYAKSETCKGTRACDGPGGNCLKDLGQDCGAPGECASGFCECANGDCSLHQCTTRAATTCEYLTACTPAGCASNNITVMNNNSDHACSSQVCDGGGTGATHCKTTDGNNCTGGAQCLSTHCSCADAGCTFSRCATTACTDCKTADVSGACTGKRAKNTLCEGNSNQGNGKACDASGNCTDRGSCGCGCSGIAGECNADASGCLNGAGASLTCSCNGSCTTPTSTCTCSF